MHSAMTIVNNTDARWIQVLARNLNADGEFVYAVKSTGIFCRPSCPSRRPRREQVEFFDSPQQAQQAGYRACRRCTPLKDNEQLARVEAACRYIEQNLDTTLSLEQISGHIGLSPFHFQRLFKRTLGVSPRQYQQARRAGKFKHALQTEPRITDAVYEAGYSSSSRAYESSDQHLGMTPSKFRQGGKGVNISYSVVTCELGKLLIATTERGLCAVRFGDEEGPLEVELREDFSAAEIQRDDRGLEKVTARIKSLLSEPVEAGTIPLDIQGTAFQQRVWNALRDIPRGQTRSYAEIASRIGRPKAVRAVASACSSNPVALVVPCHRVVQKNGHLAGYRWGVERKAALLRAEGAARTQTRENNRAR
jgi:AraC family transcriptional regulator, regulatory protein of adaptative response / methylated-DNA-[protein]-cysteine methyltransferase